MTTDFTLILSTGRTGTKFFEKYINHTFQNSFCRHEPKPSRLFKVLANMQQKNLVSEKLIARQFAKQRNDQLQADKHYIESNSFLYQCVPGLRLRYENIRVLHLVREPREYIRSHLNHGFWKGLKRITYQYGIFWDDTSEVHIPQQNDPVQVLTARWYVVNSTIQESSRGLQYSRIRFEDIFHDDPAVRSATINSVRNFLDEKSLPQEENLQWMKKKVNKSRVDLWDEYPFHERHSAYLNEICGDLMEEYGYSRL